MNHFYFKASITFMMMYLVNLFTCNVTAADFTVDGLNYTLLSATDKTCSLASGDYQGNLVIPSTVTFNGRELTVVAVDEDALSSLPELTGVTIGSNVTILGGHAFNRTPKLEKLVIPANVKRIEPFSFNYCGIKELIIEPGDDLWIGVSDYSNRIGYPSAGTFLMCQNLEKVTIKRKFRQIEDPVPRYERYISPFCPASSFKYTSSVKEVVIGGDAEVSFKLFFMCESVEKVTFEEGITTIGESSFYKNPIKSLEFPSSMKRIEKAAFDMCEQLSNVEMNQGLEFLGTGCFGHTQIEDVIIPESITEWYYPFGNNNIIKKIQINTNAKFGDRYSNVEEVIFGSKVTMVNSPTTFQNSPLNNITVESQTPPEVIGEFTSAQYLNSTLHCPIQSLELYKQAPVWKNFWNIEGVEMSGIDNLRYDEDSSVTYYTLSGIKLECAPEKGFYIKKSGNKIEKVFK